MSLSHTTRIDLTPFDMRMREEAKLGRFGVFFYFLRVDLTDVCTSKDQSYTSLSFLLLLYLG